MPLQRSQQAGQQLRNLLLMKINMQVFKMTYSFNFMLLILRSDPSSVPGRMIIVCCVYRMWMYDDIKDDEHTAAL